MDSRGRIHELASLAAFQSTEQRVGKLVPIPAEELPALKAAAPRERRAWYEAHLTVEDKRARKAERKRQRAARKAQRRAR